MDFVFIDLHLLRQLNLSIDIESILVGIEGFHHQGLLLEIDLPLFFLVDRFVQRQSQVKQMPVVQQGRIPFGCTEEKFLQRNVLLDKRE